MEQSKLVKSILVQLKLVKSKIVKSNKVSSNKVSSNKVAGRGVVNSKFFNQKLSTFASQGASGWSRVGQILLTEIQGVGPAITSFAKLKMQV